MLTTFALGLLSALLGMAVAWTVGCPVADIVARLVSGRVRIREVLTWPRGLGQYGNSSFPAGCSLPVATTRVAAAPPRHYMAVPWNPLGKRGESSAGPLAYLDGPGWVGAVLVGAGLSR